MPIVLDVLFLIIAAIFIVVGVRRGFIKSLIQSAKFLLAVLITYFVGPITGKFVYDKFIFQPVYDWLNKMGTNVVEKLPKFLQPQEGVVGEEVYPIADSVATIISNIIGYIVTFILAIILLTILAWLLTKISDRINILGTANRVLGGVFGAVMGVVVLFIAAVIVKLLDVEGTIYSDTVIVKFLGNLAP